MTFHSSRKLFVVRIAVLSIAVASGWTAGVSRVRVAIEHTAPTSDRLAAAQGPPALELQYPRAPRAGDSARTTAARPIGKKPAAAPMDGGNPLFLPVVTYNAGGAGYAAIADVNGDGKPDLVVADSCLDDTCSSGAVGILLGNGDGTFQGETGHYNSGGYNATSVAVADVNGDGKLDAIVTNQGFGPSAHGSVTVMLGNGDGTFQPGVTYDSGAFGALSVAVGDVNGDGKPDLLVADEGGTAAVLLGNGDGTFQAAVLYGAGGDLSDSIAVGDLRGDGKLDLVVGNLSSSTVGVLLGNGDGTFQPVVSYGSGGGGVYSVAVADLNGDGIPDLVIGENGGVVGVLLGNGDGTFQSAAINETGAGSLTAVAVADINGDGNPDVVASELCASTGNCGHGSVSVLLGNGDGTFQPAVSFDSGGNASAIAVGDANGDGRPDAVVTNGPCGVSCGTSVGVLLNNTGPHTPTTTSLSSSENPVDTGTVVTYTAVVAGESGAVTGTITFSDNGAPLATVAVSGNQAVRMVGYGAAGTHAITATYSGDLHNGGSTSATLIEQVEQTTVTRLTASGSPSAGGQPVTFTATVSWKQGAVPNGELVTFYDGSAEIGTGLTGGGVATFTTSSLAPKDHAIKATYGGDPTFAPSTGIVWQLVERYPSTTVLTSGPSPSIYGQNVTLTATVTSNAPGGPTGKVTFRWGNDRYDTVALNAGIATLVRSLLPVGTDTITAEYDGDSLSAKSSGAVAQSVSPAESTTTTLVSDLNPSSFRLTVTFTATVSTTGPIPPTGDVIFSAPRNAFWVKRPVVGGVAQGSTSDLPGGVTGVTARYLGGASFGASTSATLSQVVNPAPTTVSLTASPNPSVKGDVVTLTATVTSPNWSVGPAQGVITFSAGGTVLGTRSVDGATLRTKALPVGTTVVTATYSGSQDFSAGSASITQTVQPK